MRATVSSFQSLLAHLAVAAAGLAAGVVSDHLGMGTFFLGLGVLVLAAGGWLLRGLVATVPAARADVAA